MNSLWSRFIFSWIVTILWISGGALVFMIASNQNHEPDLSFGDAVYFSIISVSTVGFGDIAPESTFSRFFLIFWAVLGVAVVQFSLHQSTHHTHTHTIRNNKLPPFDPFNTLLHTAKKVPKEWMRRKYYQRLHNSTKFANLQGFSSLRLRVPFCRNCCSFLHQPLYTQPEESRGFNIFSC